MSLMNMKAELRRFGITQKEVAKALGMTENNFGLKVNERIPMTVDEAKFINRTFLPTIKLDYLLESDGDVPTEQEKDIANLNAIENIVRDIGAVDAFGPAIAEMRAEIEGKAS